MARVVSVGSVNVDRTVALDGDALADLARREWFPEAGETVLLDEVPALPAFDWRVTVGGKGANQAVAAAAAGADAAFLGTVGEDHADADVLGTLRRRGVDASGVEVADAPTGTAYVFLDPDAENRIAVVSGANAAVDAAYLDRHWPAVEAADAVVVQHELPTATVDVLLSRLDGLVGRPLIVFDPAPAEGAAPLLRHECVDVVTPNDAEHRALADALADFEGTVVRTRGPDPVAVSDADDFSVAPPAVDPVDTTGAGDVFTGYLAAELADGSALRDAVETATVAASLSTTAEGAQDAVPTTADVEAFVAGRGQ